MLKWADQNPLFATFKKRYYCFHTSCDVVHISVFDVGSGPKYCAQANIPAIQPKATYTFVFKENNRIGYEAWRNKNNKKDPLKLEVWFSHLSFGDGTGFTSLSGLPFPFKNDPKELGGV